MKKFVKILSLSLVAVMLLAMLASCAPASDPDKAVEALKAEGYTTFRDNTVFPTAFKLAGYSLNVVVTGTKTIKDKDGKPLMDEQEITEAISFRDGRCGSRTQPSAVSRDFACAGCATASRLAAISTPNRRSGLATWHTICPNRSLTQRRT